MEQALPALQMDEAAAAATLALPDAQLDGEGEAEFFIPCRGMGLSCVKVPKSIMFLWVEERCQEFFIIIS